MITVRIPTLGEVTILLSSIYYAGGVFYISCVGINGYLRCSKFSLQDDLTYDYGWIHIVSYTIDGVTTSCDHYTSIS